MSRNIRVQAGVKLIALLLIAGGAVGEVFELWNVGQLLRREPAQAFWNVIVLAVFACCVATGVGLWKGKGWAYTTAAILFIAQAPVVTGPRFVYEFYTGLNAVILDQTRDTLFGVSVTFGAVFDAYLPGDSPQFGLGLNLVPVLILFYLWKVAWPSPPGIQEPAKLINPV